MPNKLKTFIKQPISKKYYSILWVLNYIKTQYFYRLFLKKLGKRSIVCKPLFWTPEKISIGNKCYIWGGCRMQALDSYKKQTFDSHIILEDNVSIQERCHISATSKLVIGNNTTIASNVMIQDSDHSYEQLDINILNQDLICKQVEIGKNCFIGTGTKIFAGTKLGKHCIVGANSVVRGIFPDYCVLAGVPAKIVKIYNKEDKKWEKVNRHEH